MKIFDEFKMAGKSVADKEAISKALNEEIDLTIDEDGKVYNEGGQYIADAIQEDY